MNQEEEEADRRERMRIEAINEIFLSEKYYVRDLETVVKVNRNKHEWTKNKHEWIKKNMNKKNQWNFPKWEILC